MARTLQFTAAFTAGTLDGTLAARSDASVYYLGQERLENMIVLPQGPAERRWGTVLKSVISFQDCRLEPFEFNDTENYIIAFFNGLIRVYQASGSLEIEITAPYGTEEIYELRMVQFGDLMVICHPNHAPRELRRLSTSWELAIFQFAGENGRNIGQYKFVSGDIDPSATTGSITLTTSTPYFINDDPDDPAQTHIGKIFKIKTGYVQITGVTSETVATATVLNNGNLPDHNPTDDWSEQAWSPLRGWPGAVTLHEGRLYFAGSRDVPDHIWGSRVNDYRSFNIGTNAADPLSFSTSTGKVGQIRHLRSGPGGIEVFKATEEGLVPSSANDPITPTTVAYRMQTNYGCTTAKIASIDDATVFVQRDGGSIREFRFVDVNERYGTEVLNLRAPSLLDRPFSLCVIKDAFNRKADYLFAVNENGSVAVLSTALSQDVRAWSKWTTAGRVMDMAVSGGFLWWAVYRNGRMCLEIFTPDSLCDSEVDHSADPDADTFAGYNHLAGLTVDVIAPSGYIGQFTVSSTGVIPNPTEAPSARAGLPFRFFLRSMPVDGQQQKSIGLRKRMSKVVVRVQDTQGLLVNGRVVPMPAYLTTGDYEVRMLGWADDPRYEITQSGPFYAMILGVGATVTVN